MNRPDKYELGAFLGGSFFIRWIKVWARSTTAAAPLAFA